MTVEQLVQQFLSKLNPNELGVSALVWLLALGGALFFGKQVWPWLKTEYFPRIWKQKETQIAAELAREERQTTALDKIGDALIELKGLGVEQARTLRIHDEWTRNAYLADKTGKNFTLPEHK